MASPFCLGWSSGLVRLAFSVWRRLWMLLRGGAGLLLRSRPGLGCWPRLLLQFRTRSGSRLLGRRTGFGCGPVLLLRRRAGLRCWPILRLWCGASLRLWRRTCFRDGPRLGLRGRAGFGACAGVELAGALFRGSWCGALTVGALLYSGCGASFRHGTLLVSGLAGCGTRLGHGVLAVTGLAGSCLRHRTLFICGLTGPCRLDRGLTGPLFVPRLTGALTISGLAGALTAVGRTGHVFTRDLGLLLFACHGWRGRRNGTSGSDWAGHGNFSWPPAIGGVELLPVLGGGLSDLTLLGQRRHACLAGSSPFRWTRPDVDAAASSVVADIVVNAAGVGDVVIDNWAVVDIADASNVGHAAVVVEVVVVPIATEVANADIAVAVVDTTVVADVSAPVAVVEAVTATIVAPVRRGPESAVVGGRAPNAGNPVVAARAPCPVAGCPDIVGFRSGWLIVLR